MLTSPVEWGIVAAVALLVFGPKKFPELGRSLGKGIGNFKKALNEAQEEVVAGIDETAGRDGEGKNTRQSNKKRKTTAQDESSYDEDLSESEEPESELRAGTPSNKAGKS